MQSKQKKKDLAEPDLFGIGVDHGLRNSLPFIVARPGADGVDVPPVPLVLGVHGGVPVHLRRGGLQEAGLDPFGQPEHVEGTNGVGLDGLDGVVHVLDGGGRGG